ncbi:MAG: translation elongation factor Ts [Planctomycetaceae bacterium]|jgi:elongation factor Ts|nr:translation elongation factor Ts [Planctomycetaceae bacterium]
MSNISATAVADLRKQTGAGLMDCKKALQESNGDYEGALEYLRKKGQKVAEKVADRDTTEGCVVTILSDDKTTGVVLALCCQTDFVAKNEGFTELANRIGKLAFEHNAENVEQLNALSIDGMTVAEKLVEQTGKIGEKLVVSELYRLKGDRLSSYIHAGSKIGVLLSFKDGGKPGADEFFRGVAMHIAAMKPSILHYSEFDPAFVANETESMANRIKIENEDLTRLGKPLKTVPQYVSRLQLTPEVMKAAEDAIKEVLKAEGKPEKIWDKIVPGKLDRFVADNTLLDQDRCLLNQFYVLDETKTVEAAVKAFADSAGIVAFRRVAIG